MKFVKKLTALFLAVCMVMAMGITSFAATTTTKNLTIATAKGHTYKVYQILTGDVSNLTQNKEEDKDSGSSGTLANFEKGSSVTKADATADSIIADLKDKTGADLGDAAAAYITKGSNVVETVVGDGSEKTVTVVTGYYLITDEYTDGVDAGDSVSRYLVTVVGDTKVAPKVQTTDIDKNIIDDKLADGTTNDPNKALDYVTDKGGKTDTAAIGDEINYEITGTVPNYAGYKYYYYVVNDTLSKGLTLDETSFTVTVGGKPLTKGTDYYVTKSTDETTGETKFVLSFENIMNYTTGDAISIKYNATVNEYALIGLEPNKNTAQVIYSNNPNQSDRGDKNDHGVPDKNVPVGETPEYITKTYVTEINLTKVDQDGMPLTGAEFTLTGENLNKVIIRTDYTWAESATGDYYLLTDGTYTKTAPQVNVYNEDGTLKTQNNLDKYQNVTTTDGGDSYTCSKKYARTTTVSTTTTDAANNSVKAEVNANGYVTFTGLNAGEYTLTETKTPTGYNTIKPIKFTISAAQNGTTSKTEGTAITWSDNSEDVTYDNGTFYVTVKNVKGNVLPSTGGMGTTVIYMAGIAMIVAAGVVVIARKRFA